MSDQSQLKDLLLPLFLILAVFVAVFLFPPMAALLGVLAPAPLVFVYLQRGKVAGLILMGLIFTVLFVLMGPQQALLFAAEYGVMAIILAEAIKIPLRMEQCIFLSALGAMFLSTLLLFVLFADREASLTEFFESQILRHFEQSMQALKKMGEKPADLNAMQEMLDQTSRMFASAYPAFILVGSLVTAAVNYFLVRLLWTRFYGQTLFPAEKFSHLALPDFLVWILILSSGSLFFLDTPVGAAGLNLFLVVMLVYFFQGLAVTVHILEAKKVPVFLWVLAFFLIFIQPMLMGLVIGLGIFDIWIDFRKIRKVETENLE